MPTPLPVPIRILIKGPSTVCWFSGPEPTRSDFGFPRALEAELLAAGRPVEVRAVTFAAERVQSTLKDWQGEILGWSPDVVVLLEGQYETLHFLLPWWLERHANSLRARPGRIRDAYRKRLLRPTWMALAKLQCKADKILDPNLRKSRPVRAAADLEKLIGHLQMMGGPLVLLFEILPPGKRGTNWFPGMGPRTIVMNEALNGVIAKIDKPNVRLFKTHHLVDKYADGDIDEATPDGMHFTPLMHRAIGAELAREITEWADTQPHLKVSD